MKIPINRNFYKEIKSMENFSGFAIHKRNPITNMIINTHTYTHTHIHNHTHTYIHTHIHNHTHTYIHTHKHTHAHMLNHSNKKDNIHKSTKLLIAIERTYTCLCYRETTLLKSEAFL